MNLSVARFEELLNAVKNISPILVLGDIGVDKYTHGEVSRISPEAPVPVLEVQSEWKKLGLAANVADNLQALEIKTSLCGVVGDDANAQVLMQLLDDHHIQKLGVIKCPGRMTTFKERITTSAQQICRVDYETKMPVATEITNKILERIENMAAVHSSIIIEDYGKGLLSSQLIQESIAIFKNAKKLVAIDPSRQTNALFYKGATLLKPNLAEAKILAEHFGHKDKHDNVEQLSAVLIDKLDLSMIVITLGAKGIAIRDKDKYKNLTVIPTHAREVFDVSGAGDTVISVLSACLVAGATLYEASWMANLAAGVVVGKKGTAVITMPELAKFYKLVSANLA